MHIFWSICLSSFKSQVVCFYNYEVTPTSNTLIFLTNPQSNVLTFKCCWKFTKQRLIGVHQFIPIDLHLISFVKWSFNATQLYMKCWNIIPTRFISKSISRLLHIPLAQKFLNWLFKNCNQTMWLLMQCQ